MRSERQKGFAIYRLAVDYPRAAVVLMIGLIVGGLVAYATTPRQEDPDILVNGFVVYLIYPGAAPGKIEANVVKPLVRRLTEVEGIKYTNSFCVRNSGMIFCRVDDELETRNVIEESQKVLNEVSRGFPREVLPPRLQEFSTMDIPILVLGISGNFGAAELDAFSSKIRDTLELVPGVRKVDVEGIRKRQVEVVLEQERLNQYRLDLLRVMQALQERNVSVPGGSLEVGNTQFNVETLNEYRSLEELKKTIVGFVGGKVPIRLEEIARSADYAYARADYLVRINRYDGASITVFRKMGADIFQVTRAVEERLEGLRSLLPPSLRIDRVVVQQDSVSKVIETFETNLGMGSLLVAAIILFHMGFRVSFVVFAAIPLSILSALSVLAFLGMKYHKISVFSLVLVLGMLVDNAIVMVENIFRRHGEGGRDRTELIVDASRQVAGPLLSSTLTTIAAFLPLFLMKGTTAAFIGDLPIVVAVALSCSLLTALVFTPLLCSWVLPGGNRGSWFPRLQLPGRFVPVPRHEAAEPADEDRGVLVRFYAWAMKWAIRGKYPVIFLWCLLFVGSLRVIPQLGLQLFPASERREFLVEVLTPAPFGVEASSEVVSQIEDHLASDARVELFMTYVGKSVPRFHYAVIRRNLLNYGHFIVKVDDYRHMKAVIADLRARAAQVPDCQLMTQEIVEGPFAGKTISLFVSGASLDECSLYADRMVEALQATPGAVDVERDHFQPVPRLIVDIDHEKCKTLGISGSLLSRTIRAAIAGAKVTTFKGKDDKEYDLIVRVDPERANDMSRLKKMTFITALGGQVPLDHIATLRTEPETSCRYRRNLEASIKVSCNVGSGGTSDEVKERIRSWVDAHVPPHIRVEYAGETEDRDKSFRSLMIALIWAVLLIFFILVAQFNSFLQPLVVLFALPLAIIGAVMGLYVSGSPFGFMAFLGIVALSGIVVNDAILLIDYINYLRAEGREDAEAVIEAGIVRHRPIYLTTITTVCGILPLALYGGSLWSPLAWVICFGIAMATVLTLVVIPLGYAIVERI